MPRIILIEPEADRPVVFARFNDHPGPLDRVNPDDVTSFELRHVDENLLTEILSPAAELFLKFSFRSRPGSLDQLDEFPHRF